jgi:hypothetical protein
MAEMTAPAALAGELTESAESLRVLGARIEQEAHSRPRLDTTGWNGPAAWACTFSLAMLARELEAAVALVRCAADLTATAAWEVRTRA